MFGAKSHSNTSKSTKRTKGSNQDSVGQTVNKPGPRDGGIQAKGQFGRPAGKTVSSPPSMKKGMIKKGVS